MPEPKNQFDDDVLRAAELLQRCKKEGICRCQVVFNFRENGDINLDQTFWIFKAKQRLLKKLLDKW